MKPVPVNDFLRDTRHRDTLKRVTDAVLELQRHSSLPTPGSLLASPLGDAVVLGAFGLGGVITPAAIIATADDYDPVDATDAMKGLANSAVLRLSSDASRSITGLMAPAAELETGRDRVLVLVNVGANDIVLENADTGSDAANRFALTGDITLAAAAAATCWYDIISSRWRVI